MNAPRKLALLAAGTCTALVGGVMVAIQPASAATVPAPPPSCTATRSGNGVDLATQPTPNDGGSPIKWYAFGIVGVSGVQHTANGSTLTLAWSGVVNGTEQFRARAVNSVGFSTWTNCTWTGAANQAPTVNAGPDQTITLPSTAALDGTVTDDGLPAGSTLTQTWAKVSGPGTVTFGNASATDTTATFSTAGSYVLSLTASDGSLSSSDQTTVTANPPVRPYIPFSSSAWIKQTIAQLGLTQNSTKTSAMRSYINSHDPHSAPNIQGLGTGWGDSWGGVVGCTDPVYKIGTGTVDPKNSWLKTTGFHASAQMAADLKSAASTGATDLPFEVIDRCGNSMFPTGFTVKGGHAAVVAGGAGTAANPYVLNVLSAGAYGNDTNGLDYRVAGSDGPNNWSSRGVIAASATIRADQVAYGIDNGSDLGQRLELFWWETDSAAGKISPPMAGFESGQAGWGAEGQVVGVTPSFVPSASCTAGEKVIVRTLQTYGAYIGDNAGAGGTSLKGEQDHGQWAGLGLSQQGLANDCGLTWNDFVAY